jgi:hypothetical protein
VPHSLPRGGPPQSKTLGDGNNYVQSHHPNKGEYP